MKNLIAVILTCASFISFSQTDTLRVNYFENFPYAYTEGNSPKGIEIDIIQEYVTWMKQKRNTNVIVKFTPYKEFSTFYSAVKEGREGVIGLGSVTANTEREKEVSFSAPYLRNVAVLITAGKVPTVKTKTPEEVTRVLGNLTAVGVNKSSHINYLNDIKNSYLPGLKINYVETQNKVLENILSQNATFGYVDIIAYWAFLKNNTSKFLKIQKVFNESKEHLSFIMPLKSKHAASLSEFFESGFGFTSTKKYHQILETYLGHEVLESVEIK